MLNTYDELRAKAVAADATAEDRISFYNWMEDQCMCCWNGECFDIDEGLNLYPVYDITYDEDGEIEEVRLVDAEIR